jgi:GntR family transcriptional regulator, arabinose operon transcriptional repressor
MEMITAEKNGYQFVQKAIRDRIIKGEWRPGCKIPSERELGKEFSLNRLTISKGLANLANEGLLVRRQGQGTFVADQQRQNLNQKRLVKFISPSPVSSWEKVPVKHGTLEGMHQVLAGEGYHVGVDFYHDAGEQIELLRRDEDAYHAGFVIWYEPEERVCGELERLKSEGYAFVLLDAYPARLEMDYVVTDNAEGSHSVVRYLAERGHRYISYVTRKVDRTSLEDRLTGFLRGLVTCDRPVWEKSVIKLESTGAEAMNQIGPALEGLLAGPQRPTAVFISNDDLALAGIEYLRAKGLRVPEDISIIGYDNMDPSAYGPVPLTTVAQDFFEMGKAASQILLEKLEGKSSSRPAQVSLKPQLIERKSVRSII